MTEENSSSKEAQTPSRDFETNLVVGLLAVQAVLAVTAVGQAYAPVVRFVLWLRIFLGGAGIWAILTGHLFWHRAVTLVFLGIAASVLYTFVPVLQQMPGMSNAKLRLIAQVGLPVLTFILLGRITDVVRAHEQARLAPPTPPAPAPVTTAARLEELKALHEQGLLSADEYEAKRTELVRSL